MRSVFLCIINFPYNNCCQ